jgi:methyl-accepting chemotaxis protein
MVRDKDMVGEPGSEENSPSQPATVEGRVAELERKLEEAEEHLNSLFQMLDCLPVNVITCDAVDFTIDYVNRTGVETLRRIEHLLPVSADNLRGQSIDIFHKEPSRIRRFLADPQHLPHQARIRLGDELIDLLAAPIYDRAGNYMRAMVTLNVVTKWVRPKEDS